VLVTLGNNRGHVMARSCMLLLVAALATLFMSSPASADGYTQGLHGAVFCANGTADCNSGTPDSDIVGIMAFYVAPAPHVDPQPLIVSGANVQTFLGEGALPKHDFWGDVSADGSGTYRGFSFDFVSTPSDPTAAPEPSTFALLLCGLAFLALPVALRRKTVVA